jgi:signal transduction histidine kinase
LRPHEIDRFGLTDSIKQLIDKISETADIDFKNQMDNIDNVLKQDDEVILYRIVQECLNNILKHSGAKNAEVKISRQANSIEVTIADDGKGFDMERLTSQAKGSFGIKGLTERVNLLRGNIEIMTFEGNGSTTRTIIPN